MLSRYMFIKHSLFFFSHIKYKIPVMEIQTHNACRNTYIMIEQVCIILRELHIDIVVRSVFIQIIFKRFSKSVFNQKFCELAITNKTII